MSACPHIAHTAQGVPHCVFAESATAGLTAENRRLRLLLADVHTSLIAAGWHEDSLLREIKVTLRPTPPAP